jgi:hypothetical protein
MRPIGHVFGVILIGLAETAQAISLPVDGTYGAGAGCEIAAVHGVAALVEDGGTEDFEESRTKGGDDIVVTRSYAVGPDYVCRPGTVDGEYVALLCESWGATWVPMPVARFELSGESLRFTMPDEATLTLERCPL